MNTVSMYEREPIDALESYTDHDGTVKYRAPDADEQSQNNVSTEPYKSQDLSQTQETNYSRRSQTDTQPLYGRNAYVLKDNIRVVFAHHMYPPFLSK